MNNLKKYNHKKNIKNPKEDFNRSFTELEIKEFENKEEDLPMYFGCIPYIVLAVIMYCLYELFYWLMFNYINV
ncbi:hypothetical protein [Flavobacterium filum]|uniref:hypothetical protein n=1 Tax=Flavobacterium filum TaxID=370974 RepID=UPI000424F4B2|nr:hypothetical protein [Flavobacterium filum]